MGMYFQFERRRDWSLRESGRSVSDGLPSIPAFAAGRRESSLTCHADELLGLESHNFLLEETGAAALY